jgi:uncharacterized protein (DUF39 family)
VRRHVAGAGKIDVVAVEKCDHIARATGEAFVDGVGLAAVRFADPIVKPRRVFPNDIHAVVLAASVNDDVLDGGVGLEKYGAQGLFQELATVVVGGDDAEFEGMADGDASI